MRLTWSRIVLPAVLMSAALLGQSTYTGQVLFSYGSGSNDNYFNETRINNNLFFGKLSVWSQFEFSDPPEIGRNFNGLRKIRFEYSGENLTLKIGDIYEVWGRGLFLNQRDDQRIDFDNGIRGLFLESKQGRLTSQILAGQSSIWKFEGLTDLRIPTYRTQQNVLAANFEMQTGESTRAAVSWLKSREHHPIPFNEFWLPDTLTLSHRLQGIRISGQRPWFDYYFDYVDKRSEKYDPMDHKYEYYGRGNGFVGNLNLYPGSWSIGIEYKNYSFADQSPLARGDFISDYNTILDYQQPPIVFHEPTTTLIGRVTHEIDFNDEIGYQVDLTGPLGEGTTLLLHYAQASRNFAWISEPDGYGLTWKKISRESYLPETSSNANPFSEIFGELDGYGMGGNLHYRMALAQTRDTPAIYQYTSSDTIRHKRYETLRANTVPTAFEYFLPGGFSIEIVAEYQTLRKGVKIFQFDHDLILSDSVQTEFYNPNGTPVDVQKNYYLSFGIGRSPGWSVVLIIDGTNVDETIDPFAVETENLLEKFMGQFIDIDRKWIAVELLYNLNPTNRLSLTYGSQRGGLVCSNGVCRQIPPFEDGLKLTLSSIF